MNIDNIFCLLNANFLAFLVFIDRQNFESHKKRKCPICGSIMHSACRTRKLRLPNTIEVVNDYNIYFSFCCSKEGCRKRFNPPSVRFANRSPNLSVLLILAGFLSKGASERKLIILEKQFSVTTRTLCRWKLWWKKIYCTSTYWRKLRMIWSLGSSDIAAFFQKFSFEKKINQDLVVDFIKNIFPIFKEVSHYLSP